MLIRTLLYVFREHGVTFEKGNIKPVLVASYLQTGSICRMRKIEEKITNSILCFREIISRTSHLMLLGDFLLFLS